MVNPQPPGPPMGLKNMRENGVRSLAVWCGSCNLHRVVNVDDQPDHLTVKSFQPRIVCTSCGHKGAYVRPEWSESKLQF